MIILAEYCCGATWPSDWSSWLQAVGSRVRISGRVMYVIMSEKYMSVPSISGRSRWRTFADSLATIFSHSFFLHRAACLRQTGVSSNPVGGPIRRWKRENVPVSLSQLWKEHSTLACWIILIFVECASVEKSIANCFYIRSELITTYAPHIPIESLHTAHLLY